MDKMHESQKEILLIPLGKILVDILEEIAVALRKAYHHHVRIGRSEEPDTAAYSDERRQFFAERLLPLVTNRKRDSLLAVLGIVDGDMFFEDKTFVFGIHSVEHASAVLALARLREDFYKKPSQRELFLRRAVTEAVYQMGRAQGFPACQQNKCVLRPVSTLWRLDEKGQQFCASCRQKLETKLEFGKMNSTRAWKKASEENPAASGPQNEKVIMPEIEAGPQKPSVEDESEIPNQIIEPEGPVPAELAAVHPENKEPDEPLIANGH